jgi:hypothetical protein
MALEPTRLPVVDVSSKADSLRTGARLFLVISLLGAAAWLYVSYKANDWTGFAIAFAVAFNAMLVSGLIVLFAGTAENVASIARSQELQINRLDDIKRAMQPQDLTKGRP